MAAIALFGAVAYARCRSAICPTSTPTSWSPPACPRQPRNHGRRRRHPLENQFSTIAGMNSMSSTNSLGNTRSRSNSTSRASSMAPRSTCRRHHPGLAHVAQGMPTPPTFYQGEPGRPAILLIALTSPTLPL